MRIGLVVPGFSADATDWCIPALRHLARTLARTDQVRVIAIRYPYRAARYEVDNAEVMALGGATRRGPATVSLWRTALEAFRSEHRRRPFDVLHAFWATESGLLTAVAGRVLRIPTLISLAGGELVAVPEIAYGDQRIAWERFKVGASLRLACAISAGSQQLVEHARQYVGHRLVHRLPLGVDLDLFKPNGTARPDVARLVHVGTLTGVKDQAMLLRAFGHLRRARPTATLDIVGDGPMRADLERLASELTAPGAVRFRGAVDHAMLPPVYRSATAFVLSSRHEAQGMVVLEAAACAIPVVGTRVGVVPELTSAVAAVADDRSLAAALAAVLDDPDSYARAAFDRARTDFGLEPSAARFRQAYTGLLGAERQPTPERVQTLSG
jgi:glycosyltransferase involved in cell wall biosynthesis